MRAGGRNRFKAPVEQTDHALNGHRAGLSCPPKEAVREEASRLIAFPSIIEPGCHSRHPRSTQKARSSRCGPQGAGSCSLTRTD